MGVCVLDHVVDYFMFLVLLLGNKVLLVCARVDPVCKRSSGDSGCSWPAHKLLFLNGYVEEYDRVV